MQRLCLRSSAGTILLLVGPFAAAQYSAAPATGSVQKRGATKNVAVELIRFEKDVTRRITALAGAEFAVKQGIGRGGPVYDPLPPEFSAGDTNITIKVDSSVGFTELLGLKFFDPVVVNVAADGVVEADRPGVRATAFRGKARHFNCFLAAAHEKNAEGNEVYSIGSMAQPTMASDGSMVRVPGEVMTCGFQLKGTDGAQYVSKEVAVGDQRRFLFTPVASGP